MNINEYPNSRFSLDSLKQMRDKGFKIESIRGDGDFKFGGDFLKELDRSKIKSYFPYSSYINKNRVVDRVSRTIKDGVGPNKKLMLDPNIVLQVENYYNNSPHGAHENKFTPKDVQNDPELESWYIRTSRLKLHDVK
jgi:hypothetical protein